MESIAGRKSALVWAVHISVLALVLLWVVPTFGLLVSSFRTGDQIASSGWWSALSTQEQSLSPIRVEGDEVVRDGAYVIEGTLFPRGASTVSAWGTSSRAIDAYKPGDTADLGDGQSRTLDDKGNYVLTSPTSLEGTRLPRIFATASQPPEFTLNNYQTVLFGQTTGTSIGRAFLNTATVSIPADRRRGACSRTASCPAHSSTRSGRDARNAVASSTTSSFRAIGPVDRPTSRLVDWSAGPVAA